MSKRTILLCRCDACGREAEGIASLHPLASMPKDMASGQLPDGWMTILVTRSPQSSDQDRYDLCRSCLTRLYTLLDIEPSRDMGEKDGASTKEA